VHDRSVCGIVVTFHPDAGFPTRLERLAGQLDALIVVDNASNPAALAMLEALAAGGAGDASAAVRRVPVRLERNPANLGIGQALNRGLELARREGYRWALLMDQDSEARPTLVATLLEIAVTHPLAPRVALVGAGYHDPIEARGTPASRSDADDAPAARALRAGHGPDEPAVATAPREVARGEPVDWVITSGSLLSLQAFAVIGPFREDFFIDYVDLEYGVRARAQGYLVLRACAHLLEHVIGAPTEHRLLWMRRWTSNHSPDRRYYRARNDTVMLRDSGRYPRGTWRLKALSRSLRTCKRVLLYESAKGAKVRAVLEGWWDGIHGRLGRRPEPGRR
jgi:rhamnosyltransferase